MPKAFRMVFGVALTALSLTVGMSPASGGDTREPAMGKLVSYAPGTATEFNREPSKLKNTLNPQIAIKRALDDGSLQNHVDSKAFWQQPRTLTVYRHALGEEISVTYWKDGKYLKAALRQLNRLCADLHSGKVARMDKSLYDSLWVAQRLAARFGFKTRMEITSGYRSPATNKSLRDRGVKAAKNSLHMTGKAVDFRIEGLPNHLLGSMMEAFGLGGVGTYHREEGGWVHVDTGKPRKWRG